MFTASFAMKFIAIYFFLVFIKSNTLAMLLPVSDLKFAQSARSNLLAPVLLAFLILGITLALAIRYTPHRTADLSITRTVVCPIHTVFKGDTIVVGHDQAQDDLYVLTTVHIKDDLRLPLFIKDITGTLSTADGDETTSAVQKRDLDNLYVSFPALKPLASAPLLRETQIAPGQSAEGMVLLHFTQPQTAWDQRKAATVTIDFYHQGPLTVTIPKP
jgi:hypothetical protein